MLVVSLQLGNGRTDLASYLGDSGLWSVFICSHKASHGKGAITDHCWQLLFANEGIFMELPAEWKGKGWGLCLSVACLAAIEGIRTEAERLGIVSRWVTSDLRKPRMWWKRKGNGRKYRLKLDVLGWDGPQFSPKLLVIPCFSFFLIHCGDFILLKSLKIKKEKLQ